MGACHSNLAARLCGEAKHRQAPIAQRPASAVEDMADLKEIDALMLKRFRRPVPAFNLGRSKPNAVSQSLPTPGTPSPIPVFPRDSRIDPHPILKSAIRWRPRGQ